MLPSDEMEPTRTAGSASKTAAEAGPRRSRISRRAQGGETASPSEQAGRRGRVRVPWRVVSSSAYPDVALSVYVKTAALGWRPEGCTAGVSVLARYLSMSASAVERGIRALTRPDPLDGVVELHSRRRTKPGGLGTTAERRLRVMPRQEAFVWVPVIAAELLEPRQLRAWAALAYAQARNLKVSEAQLGQILVHHSGRKARQPIGAAAASTVVDALESLGWLKVHRREGLQGRHIYEALEQPALPFGPTEAEIGQPVRGETVVECSSAGDGSGPPAGDGSLATKEDPQIDGLVNEGGLTSSAVGEAQVVTRVALDGRTTPKSASAATPAGRLALRADESPVPPKPQGDSRRGSYTGPDLTFSPRLAWIMEPVAWLVQRARTYVQRTFARQLGAQLSEGVEPERLRSRLEARFARTSPSDLRSIEGWLLKVAAVRWGCHDPRCEEGIRWHSGEECTECLAIRLEQRALRERQGHLDAGECPDCTTPLTETGRCRTCAPTPAGRSVPADGPTTASTRTPDPGPTHPGGASLAGRCADCGSWEDTETSDGRCGACAVQHAVHHAEAVAMDAAGAGLTGARKLPAALRACTDVRRQVTSAREAAVAAGLDQGARNAAVIAAAEEAARCWTMRRVPAAG
ncbi:hypothetical protein OS965_21850 [Streptomyces sp. H27-G5]|uniref:hypothetical protein n=1 Tax=Streptomyces sp. H27-G5 TaxID=2996698 RepID=UPI002270FB68|nr:hypothetical protein [Streptomyces sp. H27-G5]MCY0920792.1 hypothetical protein [Streptomyces sp. H27-G5]